MRDPRLDKLASVLVNYSTKVKKGDVVGILADPIAMPMVEAVYEAALKAGSCRGTTRRRRRCCNRRGGRF